MTLHAFNRDTNQSMMYVGLPLEFVDWMALHFAGRFIAFLAAIDPYGDVLIPDDISASACAELGHVVTELKGPLGNDVPRVVEQLGDFGRAGAVSTVRQIIELVAFASNENCKVVSVGD